MANGRKLFCWNGILLLNFSLVNAQEHWKAEKNKHLPFNLCTLGACRLRISALGVHTPTCQALDLPTELNPRGAPTLVSGLPKAISGLLQFSVLLPQTQRVEPTAAGERQVCLTLSASCSPNPCLAAIGIGALFWWNTLNAVFYLKSGFFFSLCFHSYFLHFILATPHCLLIHFLLVSLSHPLVLCVQQQQQQMRGEETGVKKPRLNSHTAPASGLNLWLAQYSTPQLRIRKGFLCSQLFLTLQRRFNIWISEL